MKSFFFSFIFLLLISPSISFGCSLARAQVSQFPTGLYVFIGEVTGYTAKVKSPEIRGSAYGLKIKPLEIINFPKESKDFVEVFPFGLGADCSNLGYSKKEIQAEFPIGSKVRILAVEAESLPNENKTGQIRLEAKRLLSVQRNDTKDEGITSATSVFDYSNAEKQYQILDFELFKDLARLENTISEDAKVKVIERLIDLQWGLIKFDQLIPKYIKNTDTQKYLLEKRKNYESKWNDRKF